MQENSISQIVVVKKDKYIGIVHLHDIVKQECFNEKRYRHEILRSFRNF